jgi:serine/threonine protein kinase
MPLPAQQLLSELSRHGLLCRTSPDDAFRSLDLDDRSDENLVVSRLVDRGHLTEFQARVIRAGQIPNLLVDQYVILDKLGEGGMGIVFKARHKLMDRLVAIKLLTPELSRRPELARRFHREIKTQSKLSHPAIVAAFDAGEVRGSLYLVMEYVDGDNFSSIVRSRGTFGPADALELVRQAAIGLAFAHRLGVIHRDIKPQNLLLDRSGRLKILDFGLARLSWPGEIGHSDSDSDTGDTTADPRREHRLERPEVSELTMAGQIMGTVDYMAPEQVLDSRAVDGRCDIYSLGCTLHFLLSGQVVFPGKSAIEKVIAHRESPVPSLATFLSGLPSETAELLDGVFRKMVAKDRADRFETAQELADALRRAQTALTQPSPPARAKAAAPNPPASNTTASSNSDSTTRPRTERDTGTPNRRGDRPSAATSPAKPAAPSPAGKTSSRSDPPSRRAAATSTQRPEPRKGDSTTAAQPPRKTATASSTFQPSTAEAGVDDDEDDSSADIELTQPFWTRNRIIAASLATAVVAGILVYVLQPPSRDAALVIEPDRHLVPEVDVSGDQEGENGKPASGNLKRKFKL